MKQMRTKEAKKVDRAMKSIARLSVIHLLMRMTKKKIAGNLYDVRQFKRKYI